MDCPGFFFCGGQRPVELSAAEIGTGDTVPTTRISRPAIVGMSVRSMKSMFRNSFRLLSFLSSTSSPASQGATKLTGYTDLPSVFRDVAWGPKRANRQVLFASGGQL